MKHITYEMWDNDFNVIAQPGDSVDERIVDDFMNNLPPVRMGSGYLQAGGAYSHIPDENGKLRPTFTTFYWKDGQWIYAGHCFVGQIEHQSASGDPFRP